MEADAPLHVTTSKALHDNDCRIKGLQMSTCMASSSPPTVTLHPNPSASATPISPSPNARKHTRGRFAEEYAVYRRKQDEYYDLIQQTKMGYQEQMKVYRVQQEAAERQCRVYEAHLEMGTAIKNRLMTRVHTWKGWLQNAKLNL